MSWSIITYLGQKYANEAEEYENHEDRDEGACMTRESK
jgi:hypothetical protein